MRKEKVIRTLPYYRDIIRMIPKSVDDIEKEDIFPLMLLISLVFTLILGVIFSVFDLITAPMSKHPFEHIILALIHLIICPVFSYGLLIAYYGMKKGLKKTVYVSGLLSSIILIIAGGFWASVGGAIALITVVIYMMKMERMLDL